MLMTKVTGPDESIYHKEYEKAVRDIYEDDL